MATEVKVVRCVHCDSPMVSVPGGSVCPKGCGGLCPRLTKEEHAASIRELKRSALPLAVRLESVRAVSSRDSHYASPALYAVPDSSSVWRRIRKSVGKPRPTGSVVAWSAADGQVLLLAIYDLADTEELAFLRRPCEQPADDPEQGP